MTADRPAAGGDPLGKRALFSPPGPTRTAATRAPVAESIDGVRALYSPGSHRRLGTVVIECSDCLVRSRRSLIDLGVRLLTFSVWLPGRTYSRWLVCPACDRRTWVRVHWTG